MTHEFDHVRAAFASSLPGRLLSGTRDALAAGWQSSSFGSAMREFTHRLPSGVDRVRPLAIAVAIAAALQPVLIVMMPRTARPWMPWIVFIVVALIAIVAALRPDAIVTAWPQSRIVRAFRR